MITIWIAYFIYASSFISQILLNRKLRSAKGLSDLFILFCLSEQFTYGYFVYCKNLPLVYKVMMPILMLLVLIIVFQRLYYALRIRKKVKHAYFFNMIALLVLFFCALFIPGIIGDVCGWTAVFIGVWQHLPQIIKVFISKSVRGFSFEFVYIIFAGYAFELISALVQGLPTQIIVNSTRGVIVFSIFFLQFILYSRRFKKFRNIVRKKIPFVFPEKATKQI